MGLEGNKGSQKRKRNVNQENIGGGMKIRENIGAVLLVVAFLLLAATMGGTEASYRLILFLVSIASFLAIIGHEIYQLEAIKWSKKTTAKIIIVNYFTIMLLTPFSLPVVIQWLNTAIALALLIKWAIPLIKKETGWGSQPVT